jgi:hypothetical protein
MVAAGLDALVGSEPPPEAIEAALATVPGTSLPDALRALAREHGIAALPVLRYCLGGRGEWAIAAAAALGTLPNPEAAAALRAAEARGGSKALRTAARRALYRLRQAGVTPPAPAAPAPRARSLRPAAAWMSAVDGTGSRGLWLALEGAYGERTLLAAVVSDEIGLVDFSGGPIAKKRLDERLRALRAESGLPWVAVPPAWAWSTLAAAAARAREAGQPVPADLAGWLERLGPPPFAAPPIHDRLPAAALGDPALLERSAELLDRPELAGWFLDPAGLTSEGLEWLQARESRLVVSEHAKAERRQALVDRVVESRLDAAARARWARRLEEQAWVLLELGAAPGAAMAAAVAAALAEPDRPARTLPFVRTLVERSLEVAGEVASGRVPAEQVSRTPRPSAARPSAPGDA